LVLPVDRNPDFQEIGRVLLAREQRYLEHQHRIDAQPDLLCRYFVGVLVEPLERQELQMHWVPEGRLQLEAPPADHSRPVAQGLRPCGDYELFVR
jgi:hypothetical protein